MKNLKEKFSELKNNNIDLFNETFESVKKSKSVYGLTFIETGESRIKYSQWAENEAMPYDKASQETIAGAICFPELGYKVELISKIIFKGGVVDTNNYR